MADKNKVGPGEKLFPEEALYLKSLGYSLSKDVFDRDICSEKPNTSTNYNHAVAMLARLIGYRDHWDKDFQKGRKAFRKIYVIRK